MSLLVNYGSSDESSDDDRPREVQHVSSRAVHKQQQQGRPRPKPKQPDIQLAAPQSLSIHRPEHSGDTDDRPRSINIFMDESGVVEPIRKRSLLSSLPPPKSSKSMKGFSKEDQVNKGLSDVDSSTTIKRSFLNLPPPKKKSQTVKITLPSLPDPGSDDNDDEPVAKKPIPSKGVSGLLSMLPKPRSAMNSRILVPHTVSRKPQPSKPKPQIKPSPKKTNTAVSSVISADYGSDDDDFEHEGSSFFSLGASTAPVSEVSSISKGTTDKLESKFSLTSLRLRTLNTSYNADSSSVDNNTKSSVNPEVNIVLPESSYCQSKSSSSSHNNSTSASTISTSILTPTITSRTDANTFSELSSTSNSGPDFNLPSHNTNIADAPLSFNKSHSNTAAGYGHVTSSYYDDYDYSSNYQEGQNTYEYNQPYQDSIESYPDSTAVENQQQANVQETNIEEEEFRRFFGKTRGSEDVNMISINADEQTAGSNTREALLKGISEEKQPMSYSKKKKVPTATLR